MHSISEQKQNLQIKLVCFSIIHEELTVFLQEHKLPVNPLVSPFDIDKTVKDTFENTCKLSLQSLYIEQLYTVAQNNWNITIVYFILVPSVMIVHKTQWYAINKITQTSLDHPIIGYAVQRLQWKIEYTNVVYSLLPVSFTLGELQKTYEAILAKSLDKRNFRKKIHTLHFLQSTKRKRYGTSRPAQMYEFIDRKPVIINMFG